MAQDLDLEVKVADALVSGPATAHKLDVAVDVKDGVVTLSGSVSDEGERTAAETASKGVAGVKQVNNKLSVSKV